MEFVLGILIVALFLCILQYLTKPNFATITTVEKLPIGSYSILDCKEVAEWIGDDANGCACHGFLLILHSPVAFNFHSNHRDDIRKIYTLFITGRSYRELLQPEKTIVIASVNGVKELQMRENNGAIYSIKY